MVNSSPNIAGKIEVWRQDGKTVNLGGSKMSVDFDGKRHKLVIKNME